jgi:autotransporter family porin
MRLIDGRRSIISFAMYRAAAKSRTFWLVTVPILTYSSLVASGPVLAQACTSGSVPSGSITCGPEGNNYLGGISLSATTPGDLHVTLQGGVNVAPGSGIIGANVTNFAGGGAFVTTNGAISTQGSLAHGIQASSDVNVTINNSAAISTTGSEARGINVLEPSGTVGITNSGTITTQGFSAAGIWVPHPGFPGPSSTTITNSADITTNGAEAASAIRVTLHEPGNTGSATVNLNGGVLTTNGQLTSPAIMVATNGPGSATVNMNEGALVNMSAHQDSHGLDAQAHGTGDATVHFNAGSLTTHGGIGGVAWNGVGSVQGTGVGNIILTSAPGTVVNALGNTFNSNGLAALGGSAAAGTSVRLDSQSTITATNFGLDAQSFAGAPVTVTQTGGSINAGNVGINVATAGAAMVTNSGPIITSNNGSTGIRLSAGGDISAVGNASTVIAAGDGARGILVNGGFLVLVTNGASASVLGGSGDGLGISIRGAAAFLTNDGTIGALSDRAVIGDAHILNNGTMTGFVALTGSNVYINNGAFNFRHFADTNGDRMRDTLRVAVSDLGGAGSTFTNVGTLALPGTSGATTLDSAGQFLPLGNAANAMALGGPVQGQILGATTFTNFGTIDLQANPTPGDVLLISRGHIPGTNGGGTFVSDGGRLLIDTVLNEGEPASQSDVLVLDNATVGAGGATGLSVRNAGGPGDLTLGNGILVVHAVNGGATTPGAFSLSAPAVAGPYEYTLERGSLDASGPDDWFLRSALDCAHVPHLPGCAGPPGPTPPEPPGPTPPEPPEPTPPEPIPHYRQEVSLDMALQPMAVIYGRHLIDTLHERIGEEEQLKGRADLWQDPTFNGIWGRVIGHYGHRDGNPLGIYGGGPEFDYAFGGLQTGLDFYASEHQDGSRDHAGMYFAFGHGEMDVNHNLLAVEFDGGDDAFDAISLGGYWTHFGVTGWYLDAVAQATFYDMTTASHRGLRDGETDGTGLAASLEAGYPFAFGDGWTVEPQAQLVHQNISFDDLSDGAATVRFQDVDSLAGRIGARVARTWAVSPEEQGNGGALARLMTAWGRVNLWREFLAEATMEFSSASGFIPFSQHLEETWIEGELGASLQLTASTTLYGNVDCQTTFDGDAWDVSGKIGLRVNW